MLRRSVFIVAVLLVAAGALAQTTSNLTGTVTSGGSPLPGVTVTISSPNLQAERAAVTGETGAYTFAALPPGQYTVHFELSGLQPVTRKVSLQLSQTSRADAELKQGVQEAITVTASAPSVLETPQIAANFSAKMIDDLPVARTITGAATLAPGVSGQTLSANQFSISGSPGYDNLVMVNGVVITENIRSQFLNLFVEDAVQETTVLSGAISAEYGRFTGGVVNTITKSGGNEFSGSIRDSLSNPAWTKKTPYAAQTNPIHHTDSVYEGTLGGFVMKDRLWFFGAGRKANTSTPSATIGVTAKRNAIDYIAGADEKRYEMKLTGQITPKHNVVASYLKIDRQETNTVFGNVYDLQSLTDRGRPDSLASFHYNGVLTSSLLLEGQYSRRTMAFVGSGAKFTDVEHGTLLLDRNNGNTRFYSPTFCGVCDPETRDNHEWLAKGNYFLSTRALGNHNVVAGIDSFAEQRFANNHQSGSDFRVFVTSANFAPDGTVYATFDPARTFIRWTPIFVGAQKNNLKTNSAFINDKWDFTSHWSFNAGVRYDANHSVDGNGNVASDDKAFSPRLTAIFDPKGDGRHRFTASYNTYVSRIVDGVASSNSSAGSPATIDFAYGGPSINTTNPFGTPTADALHQVFAWFNSQCDASGKCGAQNLSLLRVGGVRSVPGYAAVFTSTLKSPATDEITLGYAAQIGRNGFAKVDFIKRDWRDFYASRVLQSNPEALTNPLSIPVDLTIVTNSSDIKRAYRGVQFQGAWRPTRWNLGANYTWSKLTGNDEGENAGSGPITNAPLKDFYPEYAGYAQRLPMGYLSGDARHRLRAWAGYDFTLGPVGTLNVSALQSYDSGRPYAAVAAIDLLNYAGAPKVTGYAGGPVGTGNYYFGGRDKYRFASASHTDLALNYSLRLFKGELFLQTELINMFNQHALTGSDTGGGIRTTVTTAATSTNFAAFNPFTTTPVECPRGTAAATCKAMGANYQLASDFGQATSFAGYQQARTYRFSMGFRF
ncbi:MAG: hypothetical protein JWN02_2497 [Acidobacteria bacterium]|nr:hypothetical protein [Acidobacteriota bacterium]